MSEQEIRDKTAAMRSGQLKMRREGEYWTDEERITLKVRYLAGIAINVIALELERTESAINQQIDKMQLGFKNSRLPRKSCPSPKEPVCLCSVCTIDRSQCPRCEHYHAQQEVE